MRRASIAIFALLWVGSGCRQIAGYGPGQSDALALDARFESSVDLSSMEARGDASMDGPSADAPRADADGPSGDGAVPIEPWGSWSAKLTTIPACDPTWPELIVTTTADELDGGNNLKNTSDAGPFLSFREAFQIAVNLGTPQTIRFDATVFPVAAPAEIVFDAQKFFPTTGPTVCIDGRDRGVVLRWTIKQPIPTAVPNLGADSLVVGISLLDIPQKIYMASAAQVAGCRIRANYIALSLGPDTVVGPGNVLWGGTWILEAMAPFTGMWVLGNDFGHDPRSGQELPYTQAATGNAAPIFEGNVFARGSASVFNGLPTLAAPVVRKNFFGVDRHSKPLPSGCAALTFLGGTWTIGPDNIFRDCAGSAIEVGGGAIVLITKNSISGGAAKAIKSPGTAVIAPTLTSASPTEIKGACAIPGEVELFSDAGNQAETYLGSLTCTLNESWTYPLTGAPLAQGRRVTATLTNAGRTSELAAHVTVQ